MDLPAPSDFYPKCARATRMAYGVLKLNSVDSALFKLRSRPLRAIEGKDFSHLPKRFWVSRDGEANAEFLALLDAWSADGIRWQALIRMIRYGRKVDNGKIIRWAWGPLEADFPDRHAAFANSAEWLRKRR